MGAEELNYSEAKRLRGERSARWRLRMSEHKQCDLRSLRGRCRCGDVVSSSSLGTYSFCVTKSAKG
jgi:hypothetical protein